MGVIPLWVWPENKAKGHHSLFIVPCFRAHAYTEIGLTRETGAPHM